MLLTCLAALNTYAQPANDDPCNAITLTPTPTCAYQIFTNQNATASVGVQAPGCAGYSGGDVWFKVQVPCNGAITLNTQQGVITDAGMALYSGDCNNLTLIECDDDDSPNGLMAMISASGLVPNSTIWVRIWENGNNNNGTFGICASLPPPPGPGGTCNAALPFCTSTVYNFPNSTTLPGGLGGNGIYGCLNTTPNPVWYYMQVQNPGPLTIGLSQTNSSGGALDVDFVLWGPFADVTSSCGALSATNIVDCSYSSSNTETVDIPNAQVGEYYVMLITNFGNQPGTIVFQQTAGTATTNCAVICNNTATNTGPACPGGTFDLASTAVPNATYSWTGPNCFSSTQPNPTGVIAPSTPGTYVYTVTATNTSGSQCTATTTLTVGGLSGTFTTTNTTCPGVNDGTVIINPNPAGSYTYTLNPGAIVQNNPLFTGLAPNTYTVTFTGVAGCVGTVNNIVVSTGPPLSGTATATATSCPTVNDGTVTATSTGVAGTTYTINPGAVSNTTGIFTGLAPNTYTVTFVTPGGCTGTVAVNPIVTAGPYLTSTFTKTDPPCANINDGVITISAAGVAPHTIVLTGPGGPYTQTNPVFTNLSPGTYTYSFTDAAGCTGTGGPVILTTNTPLAATVSSTMPLCNGNANGSITVSASGGIAPYQYSINAGGTYQPSGTFTNLAVGTHIIRIRDNVGCTKDTTIQLNEPPVLIAAAVSNTTAGCSNNDGAITATANGGTAGYTYTIAGPVVNTTGATSGVFTRLATGNYTITATDAKGCTATATATVVLVDNMFLTRGQDETICVGSSATFTPQTNPETSVFTWTSTNAPATTIADASVKNAIVTPTDTSTYILHAQWGTCERWDTLAVNVLHKPVPGAGQDTMICNLSYAILRGTANNLSGSVTYLWSPAAGVVSPDQPVTDVYPAGNDTTYNYTLTVRDNYGCNFSVTDDVNVHVQPPVPAFAGHDTTAILGMPHQLTATGGSQYVWSPAAPLNNSFSPAPTATITADTKFTVIVTDVAGCIGYDTIFIKVYEGPAYYMPNAFSPNGDGLNDIFRAIPVGISKTEWFRIFNRYGELVFETNQWLKGWDGTYKGKRQPMGVYIWIIKGTDKNGKPVEMKGTVMMLP